MVGVGQGPGGCLGKLMDFPPLLRPPQLNEFLSKLDREYVILLESMWSWTSAPWVQMAVIGSDGGLAKSLFCLPAPQIGPAIRTRAVPPTCRTVNPVSQVGSWGKRGWVQSGINKKPLWGGLCHFGQFWSIFSLPTRFLNEQMVAPNMTNLERGPPGMGFKKISRWSVEAS